MAATTKVSRLGEATATATVRIQEAKAIANLMSTADESNVDDADLREAAGVVSRLLREAQESIDAIDALEARGKQLRSEA